MGHTHNASNLRRVLLALILTGTFMVVEVIGGLLSGSLALLADAGHMLTDTLALGLAAAAFQISKRPADARLTYGYQRFQVLAAFVNGLSLLLIVAWIVYEAVDRFLNPIDITAGTMLAVAVAGLVVNILSFTILHGGDQHNLNIRGAALHVLGDLLGSVAAIIAALVILYTQWTPIDPMLSLLVAALIFRSAWGLVKRSAHVLLEGAPEHVDPEQISERVTASIPEVRNAHHIHVWGLTPQELLLTMHVTLTAPVENTSDILRRVKQLLDEEFGIDHSTIEIETDDCADD